MGLSSTKKFVVISTLLLIVCIFLLFTYMTNFSPRDTAPTGPLIVFLLIYLSIVLFISIFKSLNHSYRGKNMRVGDILLKSAVLGLLPVMLISLFSIKQVGVFDIVLVVVLFGLLNFYFRRN